MFSFVVEPRQVTFHMNHMFFCRHRCVAFDATYDDLATVVKGITNSDVLVAREKITDPGYGYRYWV